MSKKVEGVLPIVVLVALLTPTMVHAGQCPTGVVAYWPLDGDGSEVVNGFAGTLVGTASFGGGVVGQALELDGLADGNPACPNCGSLERGPYLDAGTHVELSSFGGSTMSIAGWVRRESDASAGDSDAAIVTARSQCDFPPVPGTEGLGNFQLYGGLGSSLFFNFWGPRSDPGDPFSKPDSSFFTFASAPLGVWTHVAVTYDGSVANYYVDGALVQTSPASGPGGPISDELRNVQIGTDSCASFWTGGIDELSIWNLTLSAAEVADLHQRGVSGIPSCAGAADLIAGLVSDVIGLNLDKGISNSLDAKLDSALKALEDLNSNNDVAAVNSLEAFINAVEAQRGGKIPEVDADALIASAQAIIDLINAS